jgi:protein associated with RNAse G/E
MLTPFERLVQEHGQHIQLRSTKLDGSPHFAWTCRAVTAALDAILLHQPSGTPITTWQGVWTPDFESLIYFWRERWFNVIESWNKDGRLKGFYCNIITPAQVIENELRWNDLDLDLWVKADGAYSVLDEDEWSENIVRFGYTPELVSHARRALDDLIDSVERRAFPFDTLDAMTIRSAVHA